MRFSFALLLAGSLALFGCAKSEPPTAPAAAVPSLDGSYRLTKIYALGEWTNTKPDAKLEMDVKGDSMTSRGGCFGEGTNPIRIDPSKTPAEIDMLRNEDGKVTTEALGIYKFEGNELTIALGLGDEGRPKDFTPHEHVLIYVLKRK